MVNASRVFPRYQGILSVSLSDHNHFKYDDGLLIKLGLVKSAFELSVQELAVPGHLGPPGKDLRGTQVLPLNE